MPIVILTTGVRLSANGPTGVRNPLPVTAAYYGMSYYPDTENPRLTACHLSNLVSLSCG